MSDGDVDGDSLLDGEDDQDFDDVIEHPSRSTRP